MQNGGLFHSLFFFQGKEKEKKEHYFLINPNMLEICYISLLGGERNRRGAREGKNHLQERLPESVFYNHDSAFSIWSDVSRVKKHQYKILGALCRSTNLSETVRDLYFFQRPKITE